jgi:hypothetical protein
VKGFVATHRCCPESCSTCAAIPNTCDAVYNSTIVHAYNPEQRAETFCSSSIFPSRQGFGPGRSFRPSPGRTDDATVAGWKGMGLRAEEGCSVAGLETRERAVEEVPFSGMLSFIMPSARCPGNCLQPPTLTLCWKLRTVIAWYN